MSPASSSSLRRAIEQEWSRPALPESINVKQKIEASHAKARRNEDELAAEDQEWRQRKQAMQQRRERLLAIFAKCSEEERETYRQSALNAQDVDFWRRQMRTEFSKMKPFVLDMILDQVALHLGLPPVTESITTPPTE